MLSAIFRHPILLGLGVALIFLALYLTWRKHQLLRRGHLTDGQVVELIPHAGSKGGTNYSLKIAYNLPNGEPSEFETTFSSNPPLHALREKVHVMCYPDSTTPDIVAFADLYLFQWVTLCVGIFLLLMYLGFTFGPVIVSELYLPAMANPHTGLDVSVQ
jgi:hypothetical protein